jgi:hypothetical protein
MKVVRNIKFGFIALLCLMARTSILADGFHKSARCVKLIKRVEASMVSKARLAAQAAGTLPPDHAVEFVRRNTRLSWLENTVLSPSNARLVARDLLSEYRTSCTAHETRLNVNFAVRDNRYAAALAAESDMRTKLTEFELSEAEYYRKGTEIQLTSYLTGGREMNGQRLDRLKEFLTIQTLLLQMRHEFFVALADRVPLDRTIEKASSAEVLEAYRETIAEVEIPRFATLVEGHDLSDYVALFEASKTELAEAMVKDSRVPQAVRDYIAEMNAFFGFLKRYPELPDSIRSQIYFPFAYSIYLWRKLP